MGSKKSKGWKKYLFNAGIAALGCMLMVSFMLPVPAQAKNIKVGVIDCYSGPPAVYGKDALNGFKLALDISAGMIHHSCTTQYKNPKQDY